MPLSAQSGGAVDLIGKVTVTTPVPSVIFSPVSILADEAFHIEFEINPNYAIVGQFPLIVFPQFNSVVVAGANLLEYWDYCNFGCTEFIPFDVTVGSADWIIGSFGFTRTNVTNVSTGQISGLQQQQHWTAGGLSEGAFGSWQCTTTPIVDITSIGIDTSKPAADFLNTGTVVRLYKGKAE